MFIANQPSSNLEILASAAATLLLVACSTDHAVTTVRDDAAPVLIDAGADGAVEQVPDAGEEPLFRVVLHETTQVENRPLADAMVSVEQGGVIVQTVTTNHDGRVELEVDWELGPANVTAWREGYTALTYVGITQENLHSQGDAVFMQISPLTVFPVVEVGGEMLWERLVAPTSIESTSLLSYEPVGVLGWKLLTQPGVPLEIAYLHVAHPEDITTLQPRGHGYEPYHFVPGNWWRIFVPDPQGGEFFSEENPAGGMREVEPVTYELVMDPVAEHSDVWAYVVRETPYGHLTIGKAYDGSYRGSRFVVSMTATDEVHEGLVYTTVRRRWIDESPDGAQEYERWSEFRFEGGGENMDLGTISWLPPPELGQVSAEGLTWEAPSTGSTSIGVLPWNRRAYWSISAPPGVREIAWPRLPEALESVFESELEVSLYACEDYTAFGCLRGAGCDGVPASRSAAAR